MVEGVNSEELERIKAVAQQVRAEFESGRAYTQRLADLYKEYDSDSDRVSRFIAAAKATFPFGNCELTTLALQDRLKMGDLAYCYYYYTPEDSEFHTVLLIGGLRGVIVDVTADQFPGGPKIYVGPVREPWFLRV